MAFGQASVKRSLRAFRRDQRGAVAVWAVLIAPPLLGVAALAVDLSRIYSAQAEMQTAADALARAGALELDGSSSAITRATRAIDNLVANDQRFGAADRGRILAAVGGVRFLSALPADDAAAVTAAQVTTDPTRARFVEVTARPVTLTTLFPPQILGGLVDTEVGARAIGARSQRMCHAAPVFICNPVEGTGVSLLEALESPSYQGRLLSLRGKGGGSDYAPGMRGFLEPPGGHGADKVKQMFAEVSPAACYDAAGVTLRTGQVSSVDQGLNTRFGIYKGSYKKGDYPEAVNTNAYPQDSCFAAGTCDRTGDGVWNFQGYMEAKHPSKGSVSISGVTYTFNHGANSVSPSNTRPTRYQIYRWEIEQAALTAQNPDRRVLPVAVLNCQSEDLTAARVPVAGFAKVFLTQPMGEGADDVIWGELVGALKLGVDMQVRDQVDVRR